jgi:probable HAF family extracellular repeat protein
MRGASIGATVVAGGLAIGLSAGAAIAQNTSFVQLGEWSGGTINARARAVSGSGQVAVGGSNGASGDEAVKWNGPTVSGLGDLAGGAFSSEAYAVSIDGSSIFGGGADAAGNRQAFRWTSAGIMGLGFVGGGYTSIAYACAANGLSACGESVLQLPANPIPPLPVTQAFVWTQSGGMVGLGFLPGVSGTMGGELSTARAMSADGSVVVGWGFDAGGTYRAWRWTNSGGMVDLSVGALAAQARGCSPDGGTVVGQILGTTSQPFMWTQTTGMVGMGWPAGVNSGSFTDAINSGVRMIGACSNTGVAGSQQAFVWDRGLGWRNIRDVLSAAGVNMTGWTLSIAWSMSDSGRVIVGQGTDPSGNPAAWKASIPLPCVVDFDGMNGVQVQDIFAYLNAWFAGEARADFNGVGGLSVQDIFDFLNAWFAGCV